MNPLIPKIYLSFSFCQFPPDTKFSNDYNDWIEINIPPLCLPRIGEWFNAEFFLPESIQDAFEKWNFDPGVFYIRNVWHRFNREGKYEIVLEVAQSDNDNGWYNKHFHDTPY